MRLICHLQELLLLHLGRAREKGRGSMHPIPGLSFHPQDTAGGQALLSLPQAPLPISAANRCGHSRGKRGTHSLWCCIIQLGAAPSGLLRWGRVQNVLPVFHGQIRGAGVRLESRAFAAAQKEGALGPDHLSLQCLRNLLGEGVRVSKVSLPIRSS